MYSSSRSNLIKTYEVSVIHLLPAKNLFEFHAEVGEEESVVPPPPKRQWAVLE